MIPLYDRLFTLDNLTDAWRQVRRNKGCVGVDGIAVADVDRFPHGALCALAAILRNRRYTPSPTRRIAIPKTDGSPRTLAVPTIFDRIVLTAVAKGLAPIFDADFADSSTAYRPGRGLEDVERVVRKRLDDGLPWALHLDIEDFYDTLDHELLMDRLTERVDDTCVARLIARFLKAPVSDGYRLETPERGIPQGSPLSPLLSNCYLDPLDQFLERHALAFVRYSDNLLVQTRTKRDAWAAFEAIEGCLRVLRLNLNDAKCRIRSLTEGFRFLGVTYRAYDAALLLPSRRSRG